MIDPKLLREDFEGIKQALAGRGLPDNFDLWPELDQAKRALQQEVEELRAKKNSLGPSIAKAKKNGDDVSDLLADLKSCSETEKELGPKLAEIEVRLKEIELIVPNIPHDSVPPGKSEEDNIVVKHWGEVPTFDFTPKPHWEIGEDLGILDFEGAAKLSGARFALYYGKGAALERALISFMLSEHIASGYREVIPPIMVKEEAMIGSGQLPKFAEDAFRTNSEESPYYLIPTAEVALCNLNAGDILEGDSLPLKYVSYTPCFRAEAGSYGKDVRGLIRLHQFNKVELVKVCSSETSWDEHEALTRDAERILELLELPYRRMALCSGDMGISAAMTYDLEVWLPSVNTYREISSCSNTVDYQARRNKTRYRAAKGEKPQFVHLLNGSGLAVGRTFLAVLENYQQADGSVIVPKVLRPFMGGLEVIEAE